MEPAKRLKKIGIRFYGPHTPELFKWLFVEREWTNQYDHHTIGSGESRAVAAVRAISHMRDLNIKPILEDIEAHVQCHLGANAAFAEGDSGCQVYCVIGIEVER